MCTIIRNNVVLVVCSLGLLNNALVIKALAREKCSQYMSHTTISKLLGTACTTYSMYLRYPQGFTRVTPVLYLDLLSLR